MPGFRVWDSIKGSGSAFCRKAKFILKGGLGYGDGVGGSLKIGVYSESETLAGIRVAHPDEGHFCTGRQKHHGSRLALLYAKQPRLPALFYNFPRYIY